MNPVRIGKDEYHPVSKLFHWVSAAIWLAAWGIGFTSVHTPEEWDPEYHLVHLHKGVASTLLLLVVLRVAWRLARPAPPLPASMSPTMRRIAAIGHVLLYVVTLLSLPLSGWLWSSVVGTTVQLAGLVRLPPLTAPHPELSDLVGEIHTTLAWAAGALVLGHILIAIKHHFVDRDGILLRMLPSRRK